MMERKRSSQSTTISTDSQQHMSPHQDTNNGATLGSGQHTQESQIKVVLTSANHQDAPSGADQPSPFSFKVLSSNKKWTLVAMAFANFAACTCFSLLAPFFPDEASKKGASQTVIGLIFSTFELWIFVSSPFYGNFIAKIGSRFMFLSGLFTCGSCALLFGLLDKCPPGNIFVVMCFLVRSVEALGASAFVTASFAIIANEFPAHVSTVFGTLETFSGLGLMVGPPIGGALYQLGGYGLPFWVMGGLLVLCAALVFFLLPSQSEQEQPDRGSMLGLLVNPLVLVTCLIITTAAFSLGFIDPTLADHLHQFDLSTAVVGAVFVVAPAIYAVTSPLWGCLNDAKELSYPLIVMGNVLMVVSFLMLGPSPLLPFLHHELWLAIVSLAVLGLGVGCTFVCTLKCLVNGAKQLGYEDNIDTFGMISGLFNSVFSLGTFIGPTVGSVLVDYKGFDWAATITAAIYIVSAVTFALYVLWEKCCGAGGSSLPVVHSDTATQPLLGERSRVTYNSLRDSSALDNSV